MKSNFVILIPAAATFLLLAAVGCMPDRRESPTKGNLTMVTSESMAPVMVQERDTFQQLYQDTHIELQVATSREAVTRFFNDSIKVIALSRPMNREEQETGKRAKFDIAEYKIAVAAIAFIVNGSNAVAQLRTTQLDSILVGTLKDWKEVGGKNAPIEVCLPDRNSGVFEATALNLLKGANFAPPAAVAPSSEGMMKYVRSRPNALGMITSNWVSEKPEGVTVLKLSDPAAPDSLGIAGQYFGPHQAYIYRGYYPLTTDIYIYSRADEYSVAAGFITFIASAPGQKIILSSGLLPATMPIRIVELTNKSI